MLLKTVAISIILTSLSACSSNPTPEVIPVIVPSKHYSGKVLKSEIMQCPEPVRISVYRHLKWREQYIQTLIEVIETHNGTSSDDE